MKRPKSSFFTQTHDSGTIAENAAKRECLALGIDYVEGTLTDQEYGVDFYANGIPTDAKNTFDIYLGNGFINDRFIVRQPFRTNCRCKQYWLMDKYTKEWFYKGPINDYLVKNYFTNKITFALAKKYLQGLDNVGTQCDAKLFANIKDKLSSLTKDNVHISYVLDNDYWTIKMKTYAHNAYDYKMGNKAIY